MEMLRKSLLGALAVAVAAGTWARPASANLDLDEMAALLALPFLTAEGETTEIVVTNGLTEAINLHINIINGDDGDEKWETYSFDCPVTARETTHFVFRGPELEGPSGPPATLVETTMKRRKRVKAPEGGSVVDFECSASGADSSSTEDELNIEMSEVLKSADGIMVVAVEQGGVSVSKNAIFGDSTIIDPVGGAAFSVGAISFQGLDPLNNDGDAQYKFDGLEYAQYPSSLATNFLAPSKMVDGALLVFTLDGTGNHTPVPVSVRVLFYNDDEKERDAKFDFDCFDIVFLEDIDLRFARRALGSRAGHMTMTPEPVRVETVHELTGDLILGPNDFRNTPFHGWFVQEFGFSEGRECIDECEDEDEMEPDEFALAARKLAHSVNAHAQLPGDVVNFNAAR